jgi:hypothetical protein
MALPPSRSSTFFRHRFDQTGAVLALLSTLDDSFFRAWLFYLAVHPGNRILFSNYTDIPCPSPVGQGSAAHQKKGRRNVLDYQKEQIGRKKSIQENVLMGKLRIVMEFLDFLKQRKKWWLMPVVIILLILGILIVFAGSSSLAPFIYTLF